MYKLKNLTLLSILSIPLIISSCTKSTTTTTTVLGNWISRSEFEGVARSEGVSFVINTKAYIGTGYDGTNRLSDIWQYDPVQNFWIQKANMPGVARSSAVAFEASGKGYVGTGYDGANRLNDFYQYDDVANTWMQKSNFAGNARYDAVGFSVLGNGYIATGFDGNYLKDFWQYTPATDTWAQQVSMGGTKRSGAVAFVHNNKAYICTGNNNGSTADVNDLWVFDPTTTPIWTEERKISNVSTDTYDDAYAIVRTNAAAFVMNDKAYVTCGENGSVLGDTWEYDFVNDLWAKKTSYEGVARTGAIGFSVSNRGFTLTGRSSSTPYDDIREFFPLQTYNAND